MAKDRKCILCETVCSSKREMEEHIRSMLHHRELEKLKGRDCGHECRVCKVKVVSLTDYASHISGPSHKQKVEAADRKPAGNNGDQDYFDQALVDLIHKRKEHIRKEKEAAAAQLAKEEEERKRKEAFQQRLKEAKDHYRRECGWQQPSHRFGGSAHHNNWYNRDNGGPAEQPWHHSNQGRSATWHAQEPPNLQRWASREFRNNQEWRGNRTWGQGSFPQNPQSRLPWLSSGGSSNGLYGRNNVSQLAPRGSPMNFSGGPSMGPPWPNLVFNNFQNGGNGHRDQQRARPQNRDGQSVESDHRPQSSITSGTSPKPDKACRWSPYSVTKGPESVPDNDANQNLPDKQLNVSRHQQQEKEPEPSGSDRQSRPEQKPEHTTSSRPSIEDMRKEQPKPTTKPRDSSSSSSTSSSSQKDRPQIPPALLQKTKKPSPQTERKISSVPDLSAAQLGKASSQASTKFTGTPSSIKSSCSGPLKQSSSERQLQTSLKKAAKQLMLEKKSSLDSHNRKETAEEQQKDQSHVGVNKENSCRQKRAGKSSDCSQNLQSLQVSTSTSETCEAPGRVDQRNRKTQTCSEAPDEAMQVVEAGQSSESDAAKSREALAVPGLSRLDLPPVLKRDLTKHISSKSKAIGHEPNLNIARRVRNLSESRRSDSEKDSGLKPTVRQLISSSGSRRNVNWEQVYQEVRKKQDKGKGMPRFGIEMVPCEQEYHSLEEDDIPLLEGFQWESLMDVSSQGTSRKRSLSESSLAPALTPSLFLAPESKDTPKELGAEQQPSAPPSNHRPALAGQTKELRPVVHPELRPPDATAHKQPDKALSWTVKVLQRSDSVLGDSSSGAEQPDGQGAAKRRRAALDLAAAESSCLEHNSKRRKVKCKKERLQIDQLLSVSLREDELSRALQTVDTNLVQAQAALEAAYLEVQRLIVVKQQMSEEMSALRNRRIELLQGMRDAGKEAPQVKLEEEKLDSVNSESLVPTNGAAQCVTPPSSSVTPPPSSVIPPSSSIIPPSSSVIPPSSSIIPPSSSVTPPSSSVTPPSSSVTPPSSSVTPPSSSVIPPSSSVTPPSSSFTPLVIKEEPSSPVYINSEMNPADWAHSTTPELPGAAVSRPESVLSVPSSPQSKAELNQGIAGEPAHCKEAPQELAASAERVGESAERGVVTENTSLSSVPDSKSSIQLLSASRRDSGDLQTFQSPAAPLNLPTSPADLKTAKKVRKLKKRKTLKKAPGLEQLESTDTELDEEASRPRWLRSRRRASGASQVSTSSLHSEDGHMKPPQLHPSPLHPPQPPPDKMEFTTQAQASVPDSTRPEAQSLACNEVSSTSDMDLCKSSESEMPSTIKLPKNSLDPSSDHGEDDLPSQGAFEGHQEAVNALQIHDGLLYTCSGDRTVKVFDLVSRQCVGVFEGHSSKVSCLFVSATPSLHHRLYSGSSDQTVRCYNLKTRELEQLFPLPDRVLCLHSRWRTLFAGLANGSVVTFNLKTNRQMDVFECHGPRAVSCLASSQEGARRLLLVGSYDNTISVRDARNGLLLRLLEGHSKTVLCMKVVNDLVFSGSSDQCVHTHNIHTGELVRVSKGHSHAVTVVSVLGKVMVTACLDKLVRVYDLQSHEQLQVYSGHTDMVMCMAVHKNMIYTGCYDGSVQAVKLNLMQSFRCWWQGCSLVFGVTDHLQQHLVNDHGSSNPTLKCRWKNCEEFLGSRCSSKQGALLLHMQRHTVEETRVE